jgi:hypothetical protein
MDLENSQLYWIVFFTHDLGVDLYQHRDRFVMFIAWKINPVKYLHKAHFCCVYLYTLVSGINVASWINIAPGKFGKQNKYSPIYTIYLYY